MLKKVKDEEEERGWDQEILKIEYRLGSHDFILFLIARYIGCLLLCNVQSSCVPVIDSTN
jgi:hypothetical protein